MSSPPSLPPENHGEDNLRGNFEKIVVVSLYWTAGHFLPSITSFSSESSGFYNALTQQNVERRRRGDWPRDWGQGRRAGQEKFQSHLFCLSSLPPCRRGLSKQLFFLIAILLNNFPTQHWGPATFTNLSFDPINHQPVDLITFGFKIFIWIIFEQRQKQMYLNCDQLDISLNWLKSSESWKWK